MSQPPPRGRVARIAALLAAAVLVGSIAPAPARAAGVRAVSNDGLGLAQQAGNPKLVTRGFVGRAGRTSEAADAAAAALSAAPESPEEVWRLWSLAPATAPIGRESIIGPDDRKRVKNTRAYPFRAIALVTFSGSRCTGWLIAADTVVTAGHCVHSGGKRGGWYNVSAFRVYPGRDGSSVPFGSCTAKRLYSNTGWTEQASSQHDFGAIKLDCDIGLTTGWFGYFWTNGSLVGRRAVVSGYPGDKPLTQWRSVGEVDASRTFEVFYQNDTLGGQSGSPVYYDHPNCGICAMAVHAYGIYGRKPYADHNHGTRITQSVARMFRDWSMAD